MRPEIAKYQRELEVLVDFVEGRLDGPALKATVATDEMKSLLGAFEDPRYPAATNHHRRLSQQDLTSLGGLVNAEGIVAQFLGQAEVSFQPVKRFGGLYSLILKAVPKYL